VNQLSTKNFGLVIAYLLPGFVALWGVSYFSATIRDWLGSTSSDTPTVGGFLYVTVASLTAGLIISAVRWVIVDSIHHVTGVRNPRWDFSTLRNRVEAFEMLVSGHFRYHQFYAGMLVAVDFVYVARIIAYGRSWPIWSTIGFVLLSIVLLVASRDALGKYYDRGVMLLGTARDPAGHSDMRLDEP
jgi:hypothetical protein